jgi:cytoskeleton protein RodZ
MQESTAEAAAPAPEPVEADTPVVEPEVTAAVEPESMPETELEPESVSEPEPENTAAMTESSMDAEPEATTTETATGTRENPERNAPTGSDKLQIIVHADTWGDVKDASNHQLVYDLLRADTSIELVGEAPFAVFLGNGHGVEILFNGEDIQFSPKIRDDNTARLSIGG